MDKVTEDLKKKVRQSAKEAAKFAYAPYSNFQVGAAVLFKNGTIESGCNVENASFGLTICAERNAIAKGISKGAKEIALIVVYTPTPKPTSPCGACRQVINEFGAGCDIESICDGGDTIAMSSNKLLPQAFGPQNL